MSETTYSFAMHGAAPRGPVCSHDQAGLASLPVTAIAEATRVRLAAAATTAPDVLTRLASDPAVTVRAAVAMNTAAPGHADVLLAADNDVRVRGMVGRKLASLVPTLRGEAQEHVRRHAIATLIALVADEAVRVRAAIAEIVQGMPDAPRELILQLARDTEIAIHEPVIRLSPLLTAQDLLALLAMPPSRAALTAVAQRSNLDETVSDAIADSADAVAIQALLANGSAAIREATLDALVARAAAHEDWHEPLVRRPTLSARSATALSEIVATHLLGVLADRADLAPSVTSMLRTRLAGRLGESTNRAATAQSLEQAEADARVLFEEDQLVEEAVVAAIASDKCVLATAMLAVAADLPAAAVARAVSLRNAKALVSVVWKAAFSMKTAVSVQSQLAALPPSAVLRPVRGDGFPLAVEEMRLQIDVIKRMHR